MLGTQRVMNRYEFLVHANRCPLYLRQSLLGESLGITENGSPLMAKPASKVVPGRAVPELVSNVSAVKHAISQGSWVGAVNPNLNGLKPQWEFTDPWN